jgi:hypothetical protein
MKTKTKMQKRNLRRVGRALQRCLERAQLLLLPLQRQPLGRFGGGHRGRDLLLQPR